MNMAATFSPRVPVGLVAPVANLMATTMAAETIAHTMVIIFAALRENDRRWIKRTTTYGTKYSSIVPHKFDNSVSISIFYSSFFFQLLFATVRVGFVPGFFCFIYTVNIK